MMSAFSSKKRITQKSDYQRILRKKALFKNSYFTVFAHENNLEHARLGLGVGKKSFPKAVTRAAIKRQIRESFRLNQANLMGLDIVVLARKSSKDAGWEKGRTRLDWLLDNCWSHVKKNAPESN